VIWGFRHYLDEICALLGYYTACSGDSLPTFRDNLSVPPSRDLKKSEGTWIFWNSLKMGSIGCPETSVRNYQYTLLNVPEQRRSLRHVLQRSSVCFLSWMETARVKRLFSSKSSTPALWPTGSFPGSKTPVSEFNHSPPSSTKLRMRGAIRLQWHWQRPLYLLTCQAEASSRIFPSPTDLRRRPNKSVSITQGGRDFSGHGKFKSRKK
jgi:hypothetical protein